MEKRRLKQRRREPIFDRREPFVTFERQSGVGHQREAVGGWRLAVGGWRIVRVRASEHRADSLDFAQPPNH